MSSCEPVTPPEEWCSSLVHALYRLGVWEREVRAGFKPAPTGQLMFLYTQQRDPFASEISAVFSVHPASRGRRFPGIRGLKSSRIGRGDALRPGMACPENPFGCPKHHDPCSTLVRVRAETRPCRYTLLSGAKWGGFNECSGKSVWTVEAGVCPCGGNNRGLCREDIGPDPMNTFRFAIYDFLSMMWRPEGDSRS